MDSERKTLHNRLTNKHKSHASEIAWKRHHGSYMRGARKRSRDSLQSIYNMKDEGLENNMDIKQLNTEITNLLETEEEKDNVFELKQILSFENMAGGITFSIDRDTNYVNLTTSLENSGNGSYKSAVELDDSGLQQLYNGLKEELEALCNNFDNELKQLISKHGLRPTE